MDLLKQVGHLPQQQAADQLNVGNTRFKMATRQLGMKAWPYRKIKSIRNLISVVEENQEYFSVSGRNVVFSQTVIRFENFIGEAKTIYFVGRGGEPSQPTSAAGRNGLSAAHGSSD